MTGFKAFFWPIRRSELSHYLPIFIVTFLLGVNYHILRTLKYSLLVLAPDAGAEAIPFVQLWGLVPAAIVMTWGLARLCRVMSQAQVFYVTLLGFCAFFVLFITLLYPFHEQLEPTRLVNFLSRHLPACLSGLVAIIRHWVFSLFYVVAELWKVSVVAVLFWGFINSSLHLSQAKRFYGPLMLASSLAGVAGGLITELFPKATFVQAIPVGQPGWHRTLTVLILLVIGIALAALPLFKKIQAHAGPKKDRPTNISMRAAFSSFFASPYLIALSVIVIASYISFGLAEILWKDQLKLLCPDPASFTAYTGRVVTWASILSVAISAVLAGGIINRLPWRISAMMAPLISLAVSLLFFLFVLFQTSDLATTFAGKVCGTTPLVLAVFFGGVHNCLCRVGKTTLVDPTKELAFVPLNPTARAEGKAIIDGVGMHAGRASGALVQQLLLLVFPTVLGGAFVSAGVVIGITLLWMKSVSVVGREYENVAGDAAII